MKYDMTPHQQRLVRSLSILRRLQVGAADRQTLIDHVQSECGPFAYEAESAKAVESRLAHDIKFLRENLLVNIPSVDRSTNTYEIADFGDFRPLCLTDTELDALMTLLQSFQSGAPHSEAVAGFLVRIADLLPTAQQQVLTTKQARLRMELRYRDTETIAPAVQRAIDKAIRERRHLQFAYRTASQQDDQSRVHEVQPDHQYFDPSRGHLYLNAYWLTSDGPVGKHKQERWQSFRLDRILADEHLRVLSQKVPPLRPRRPHHQLEYWLSPQIARLGQVTRHFEEMAVHETNDAGWVRITGTTDDLFQATRFLLSYGPNCRVTGGADAKREMEKLIREMATVYGFLPTE